DPRLEAEIHGALREVMHGRTTLIIAHRRSTLNLADRIVVLDQGRVADSGTHEELAGRSALYRQLIVTGGEDEKTTAGPVRPRALDTVEDVLDDRAMASPAAAGVGRGLQTRYRAAAVSQAAGPVSAMFASMPPTPELLAQVDALPPAQDKPEVDVAEARAGD